MKKILIIFIMFSTIVLGKSYNISEKEITENIRLVNAVIFGPESLEYYNKLISGTISSETLYGKYRNKSPLGITQISPAGWGFIQSRLTEEDLMLIKMLGYENNKVKLKDLTNDHLLAILYCSLYYKHKLQGKVPKTLDECAIVWKKYYNTSAGKGTIEGFKEKYLAYGEKYLYKY